MTLTIPPRERLLQAAAELFYKDGVNPVGVDRVCQTAGVSKRTMYQLFATKDDLVAASLEAFGASVTASYLADPGLSPREWILHVFARLEEMSGDEEFHGCPFVNTAVETRDPDHPGTVVARRFKDMLTAGFAEQARAAGVADPEALAVRLVIVFDGLAVRAVMRGEPLRGLAVSTARILLDAEGFPSGRAADHGHE